MLCEEIKETTWGRKLIVKQCIDPLLNNPRPKLNFYYWEEGDYYRVDGHKCGYPFKPWLSNLGFSYVGGDKNTRHFKNATIEEQHYNHYKEQLLNLCEKFAWQLVCK